ncbi:hypothetical protein BU24DRAFT_423028 [Aaosphaeria arxii CBS 175.79]|uniref:Uncharacterized protein n=1 Tax=Aaosphaeria arxii CBS 175.79 TaxID=1450172 RepID=A0A6A5XVJ3_9PLEO|nr:uncharacterized protein BU24DRAFT_423028 [Aaosphaeria arxii CBS 175.79]KAF2016650.1 hypothetical protein BU24DRAFT_423028 [Aaosphaeria arxii CBS 175.79]
MPCSPVRKAQKEAIVWNQTNSPTLEKLPTSTPRLQDQSFSGYTPSSKDNQNPLAPPPKSSSPDKDSSASSKISRGEDSRSIQSTSLPPSPFANRDNHDIDSLTREDPEEAKCILARTPENGIAKAEAIVFEGVGLVFPVSARNRQAITRDLDRGTMWVRRKQAGGEGQEDEKNGVIKPVVYQPWSEGQ